VNFTNNYQETTSNTIKVKKSREAKIVFSLFYFVSFFIFTFAYEVIN